MSPIWRNIEAPKAANYVGFASSFEQLKKLEFTAVAAGVSQTASSLGNTQSDSPIFPAKPNAAGVDRPGPIFLRPVLRRAAS